MTVHDIHTRLRSAAGIDRLNLLNTLAQTLVEHDRLLACRTARDAYALSCEPELLSGSDIAVCARATALFIIGLCPNSAEGDPVGEAYELLGGLPVPMQARVLLRAGQIYQTAREYGRAMRCFHQADLALGGQGTVPALLNVQLMAAG